MKTKELKLFLIRTQNLRLISYLNSLKDIRRKGCQMDPRIFITPFELSFGSLRRDQSQSVILRNKKWNYLFYLRPYLINFQVDGTGWESPAPKIKYFSEEKAVKLLSTFH